MPWNSRGAAKASKRRLFQTADVTEGKGALHWVRQTRRSNVDHFPRSWRWTVLAVVAGFTSLKFTGKRKKLSVAQDHFPRSG